LSQLRHLIRAGRYDQAELLAARLVEGPQRVTAWAYRAIAWRMTSDARWPWLEQGGALVRTYDITAALPPLDALATDLRAIHTAIAAPLDQSTRGGTQTDGPLFARVEPSIRAAREAIRSAVQDHAAALRQLDPAHPAQMGAELSRPRFAGAWSVRLGGGGHHVSHVHPAGWISSALYVALPVGAGDSGQGRLTIGDPPAELGTGMAPTHTVIPCAGELTLFPSYTWHGVTPSLPGERLTIAFDVARPR
jgi:predicted 2-oxoglutarate/Fe(II)-dependent dioxygenase YbiX